MNETTKHSIPAVQSIKYQFHIVKNQQTQSLKLIGKGPITVYKHSNTPHHVQDKQACHVARTQTQTQQI